jgi:mannose-6-phosphate isomerase-like protein (cupin superfamily)
MEIIEAAGRYTPAKDGEPNHWINHVVTDDLSMGTYSIPKGGLDDQGPHNEDELYIIHTGAATMVTDSGSVEVKPGMVIFIPAGEAHVFTDVQEDFSVIGIFAPPLGKGKARQA